MDLSVHPDMAERVQEIFFRLNEMRVAFGNNNIDNFCTQVQDYVRVLLCREKDRKEYRGMSLIRQYRFNFIQFIMRIVEIEGYTRATLHLSVYLFDRYTDAYNVPRDQLYLVLISCIIIAGKVEEKDENTPKIKKLKKYLPHAPCYAPGFKDTELRILSTYVQWSLIIPTSYTFLEFFILFALDADEVRGPPLLKPNGSIFLQDDGSNCDGQRDKNNNSCNTRKKRSLEPKELDDLGFSSRNVNAIREYALEVLDSLLYEEPDDKVPPSLLAAACLMFSRRCFGYYGWTQRLAFTTSYDESAVCKVCQYVEERQIAQLSLPIYNI